MPRNGSGVYSKPVTTTAVPNTTIESAKFNSVIDDLVQDANSPRPIGAGGTGAANDAAARQNLGIGSVDNTSDATKPVSGPQQAALNAKANVAGQAFTGPISVPGLLVAGSSPVEGGQIDLAPPVGSPTLTATGIDIANNQFRVFSSFSGNLKGFYYDFASAGNGLALLITSLNIGTQSVGNAGTLGGLAPSTDSLAATIAARDSSGDITARMLRTEAGADSGNRSFFLGMDAVGGALGDNNYARPTPVSAVLNSLNVYTKPQTYSRAEVDSITVAATGDTMTGPLFVQYPDAAVEVRNTVPGNVARIDWAQVHLGGTHADYSFRGQVESDGNTWTLRQVVNGDALRVSNNGAIWSAQMGDLLTWIEGRAGVFADDRINQFRARQINPSNIDCFIVARVSNGGSTAAVQGQDYAGTSLFTARSGAAYSYAGTWRCLSAFALGSVGGSTEVGLFYRYV